MKWRMCWLRAHEAAHEAAHAVTARRNAAEETRVQSRRDCERVMVVIFIVSNKVNMLHLVGAEDLASAARGTG